MPLRPFRRTVSAVGASELINVDRAPTPTCIGFAVVLSPGASLTYTVEHTFDDIDAPGFTPASATWFPHEDIVNQTVNADGNYAFPCSAIRLNVTARTAGSATLILHQAG